MTPPTPTRRFPRAATELPVHLRVLGGRRLEEDAEVRVIGAGGCLIVSRESLGFLSLMELRITLRDRILRADARVAWEDRRSSTEHHVGVEFLRIHPADRKAIEGLVAGSSGAAA